MSFICGSFHSQEEDDYDVLWPFPSTSPRKPTRKRQIFGSRRDKHSTNPYSDRGLDKFEALLADLDEKRQKILTQKGAEDVSMVKFIYKGPNEVEPVVIKLRDQRKHGNMSPRLSTQEPDHQDNYVAFNKPEEENTKPLVHHEADTKIKFDRCKRKLAEWWKPSYYLPLFVILIMVLLMFSGRSFAILCISVCWYVVPIVNEILRESKHPNNIKKKDGVREKIKRAHN